MSWIDRNAVKTITRLGREFCVKDFIETGTFKGINAEVMSRHFRVTTVEVNEEYYREAQIRLKDKRNVNMVLMDSAEFLRRFVEEYKAEGRVDNVLFYLDAHFYNPKGPRWQVLRELEALRGFNKGIIVIHDFDNGLGHCIYDGERLGMNILKKPLKRVNKDFRFYTNRLEDCDIMGVSEATDPIMRDNLVYAHKTPRLTYRGILYAIPGEVKWDLKQL